MEALVVYGIRPEHFQLDGEGVPATVHVIEPTGSETQVMAEFAGGNIIAAFRERVTARPGEIIRITPDLIAGASVRRGDRTETRRVIAVLYLPLPALADD